MEEPIEKTKENSFNNAISLNKRFTEKCKLLDNISLSVKND